MKTSLVVVAYDLVAVGMKVVMVFPTQQRALSSFVQAMHLACDMIHWAEEQLLVGLEV